MTVDVELWSDEDRSRLRWARGVLGHTQGEAARFLQQEFGHGADKDQWSRWESGDVQTPRAPAQRALRRYVAAAEAVDAHVAAPAGPPRPERTHGSAQRAFEAVVQGLGDEPILREPSFGELQRELLKADIARHATVGSLGELDYKRLKELERLLGIVIPGDPGSE